MARRLVNCPHCGCELIKPRYPKYHRFFFAVVAAAYENWPENHPDFQPSGVEELRGWLLVQVGYYGVIDNGYQMGSDDQARFDDFFAMCFHQARLSGYGRLVIGEDGIAQMHFPLSIAWDKLDQKEFAPIAEKVFAEIEAQTGMEIASLRS